MKGRYNSDIYADFASPDSFLEKTLFWERGNDDLMMSPLTFRDLYPEGETLWLVFPGKQRLSSGHRFLEQEGFTPAIRIIRISKGCVQWWRVVLYMVECGFVRKRSTWKAIHLKSALTQRYDSPVNHVDAL